jgi:uncharacterized protein involved in outer membrane biogenesis
VVISLWLFAGLIVTFGAAAVLAVTLDPRPVVEWYASSTLDRRLTIAALRIGWGDPLTIELSDVRLADPAWASEPDMARVASIHAELDLWPLLRGQLRFRKLDVAGPAVLLERDTDGTGNWQFHPGALPAGRVVGVAASRARTPTLIDAVLRDGALRYRTSSGALLHIDAHDLTVTTDGDDQPVHIALDGAYNGLPGKVTIEAQSFAALRAGADPFPVVVSIATATARVDFTGTFTDPLNFDGAVGPIAADIERPDDVFAPFGTTSPVDVPLRFAGAFTKTGLQWLVSNASGTVGASAFTGSTLALLEAPRGKSDDVTFDLGFPALDLMPLLAGAVRADNRVSRGWDSLTQDLAAQRGTNIEAHIAAAQVAYGTARVDDASVRFRLVTGQTEVSQLGFAFAAGRVDASATARATGPAAHVTAQAKLVGADSGALARLGGIAAGQIAGRIDGGAELDMTGETLAAALRAGHGHAVLAMTQGQVARALLEQAATDLRALFRPGVGMARITCLLGVVDLRNGIGTIAPLWLRTPETTLIGGGSVDLLTQRLDLTIRSEAASTGIFALGMPLRISGPFSKLGVQPAIGSAARWLDAPARDLLAQDMPADLRQLAERDSCLR